MMTIFMMNCIFYYILCGIYSLFKNTNNFLLNCQIFKSNKLYINKFINKLYGINSI